MAALRDSDVREHLDAATSAAILWLECFDSIDSTNTYLLDAEPPPAGAWYVAIADEQTAGRGRAGHRWQSAPGAGLWMSAACTFAEAPAGLSALTLALGAVVAEALSALGVDGIALKWPNDLLVGDRKLGGMLVESAHGGRTAVCGIGINLDTPAPIDDERALEPIGLRAVMDAAPARGELAARLLTRMVAAAPRFVADGFAPFRSAWSAFDWLKDRPVTVSGANAPLSGVARGIDDSGALRVVAGGREHSVSAGSVRPVAPGDAA